MSIWEIISGSLLIAASLVIIFLVLVQQPSGRGLSGAISGGEMQASSESRTRTTEAVQVRYTKIAAIVFFGITIAVSLFSLYAK